MLDKRRVVALTRKRGFFDPENIAVVVEERVRCSGMIKLQLHLMSSGQSREASTVLLNSAS